MRLDRATIDWTCFEPQAGDEPPIPFSYRTKERLQNKVLCHMGYTTPKTHEVIRKNLDQIPSIRRDDQGCRSPLLPFDRG